MSVPTHEVCRKYQNSAKNGIKNYLVTGCPTCESLTDEYERLERFYGQAILALAAAAETAAPHEYRRLRRIADGKRIDSEMARLQLKLHKRVHLHANEPGSPTKSSGARTVRGR